LQLARVLGELKRVSKTQDTVTRHRQQKRGRLCPICYLRLAFNRDLLDFLQNKSPIAHARDSLFLKNRRTLHEASVELGITPLPNANLTTSLAKNSAQVETPIKIRFEFIT